ncbi:MAG: amino acid ABC transporter ATP-binding protein [Clostridia bacterium]|nr:amino acid ABC transporter ATP-binding protein [Clostridia bacterium]
MINVCNIVKSFGENDVLKGVSFKVEKGQAISIIGSSGSGKSTILRSIVGLENVDGGSIYIDDEPLVENGIYVDDKTFRSRSLKMGMVFQHFNLFPHLTVRENLCLAPKCVLKRGKDVLNQRCEKLLEKVGLIDKIDAMPSSLSGGQKQRVAIARALMMEPEILLFDEPTSALDPELTGEVLSVMKELAAENMTMIIVTHEMSFAREVSDRVIFMDKGVVLVDDVPEKVLVNPENERIKSFLNKL